MRPWELETLRGMYIVRNARNLVCPDVLLAERVVGKTLCEEVLEEAHIL